MAGEGCSLSGWRGDISEPTPTRTRIGFAILCFFGVVLITAYLQSVFQFSTYLALAICMIDTIVSVTFLFQMMKQVSELADPNYFYCYFHGSVPI